MSESFDIVVIGGGSAGCLVAGRLADANLGSICVLEAGPKSHSPFVRIPIGYYRTMGDPDLTWGYETVPQTHLDGRSVSCPRGRLLGGSASINGLIYIRGQHEDYNGWQELGNRNWSWQDVLPYFKRSEDQCRGPDAYHEVGGPIGVTDPIFENRACDAFIHAAIEHQIRHNDDFNGSTQEGVGRYQLTTRNGRRSTSADFLTSGRRGRQIAVFSEALVERIVVEGGKAKAVSYIQHGQAKRVYARQAVLLCAGAIGSPCILQRSGIGPADFLKEAGIEPVADKPLVGGNLQDHFQARVVFECVNDASLNHISRTSAWKVKAAAQYIARKTGPFTIGAGVVGLFTRSEPGLSRPDIQFHVMPFSVDKPGMPFHDFPGFTVSICELRPKSRGVVRIRSRDPAVAPFIDPGYFSHPEDGWAIARGIELAREIGRQEPLKSLVVKEREPGPALSSLTDLRRYAAGNGTTIFHPVGTCRMGRDEEAVVDDRLKVTGVDGIWVADGSIMPTIVSGNTNAACLMIAERAADFLKEYLRR